MTSTTEKEQDSNANQTRFQSPVPFVITIRKLIYGENKPDVYTRIAFFINMIIWLTFFLWNVLSYFVLQKTELITTQKEIRVDEIIENRGAELGFETGDFLNRLITFHSISILCWLLIFIGLVLLYRKNKRFIYLTLGPAIFYIGMSIFYLSFTYFIEDTTAFDKVALLVFVSSCIVHAYLLKNERSGGSISFFGEAEDDSEVGA